jgi:serine phosphatase RsbU (regulator of sigma subunit)
MRDISEAFSRFCIDNMLGTNFSKSVDPILSMIIKAPEGGMFFLFDRPGEIHPMHFGPAPLLILWDIIENKVNEKVYIFVLQSASVLLKKLVKTKMQQLHASTKKSNYTIVARNNISGQWFPATPVQTSELKKFSQRLQFSNKPDDFQIQINDKNYLLTGQNGKYAQNYSFFCFYPKQIIENKLTTIRKLIYLGLIVFLIVTLLAGNILSNTFLTPISRLGQGVEAIKNRNGEFRIETEQKDEFGDLSSSFNHMIEDLKEMQLAKDVQESLLPSDFPKVDRYDIEYVNRMATDVGGDYFDLQRLEDNRIIIIIGDVTGHGVSSALVMAMAKAIVYQGLKEKKSLNELFSDLNLAIHTYFQIPPARKMITLFAAVLDQSDNSLTCVNAGHNFPMKLMANGKIEDFSAVHLPIGAQKKLRNLKTCKYQLQRGDMIVFYTDGIIEVKNSQKQMYGYDKFKANLVKMTDLTAQEAINQMVETYDNFLEGNEPDDDITVILVKRIE